MSQKEQIEQWAREQPWLHIGVVVVVGYLPEAVDVIRRCKGICDIIVYDPDGEGDGKDEHEGEDGYWRVKLLDSVRNKMGHRRWPHWSVAMLAPPEMQGAGRFEAIAAELESLLEAYGSELDKSDVRAITQAQGDIKNIVTELADAHPAHVSRVSAAVMDGEQFARCRHLTMFCNVKRWTEIGLDLLPEYIGKTPIHALAGARKGCDGLIVGAGPSLNAAMFWLPAVQDRLVICATEAALPVLDRFGVKPDVVVAVEAQDAAFEGLEDLELWKTAIMVPGIHASRKAWELPAAHICPCPQAIGPLGHWLIEGLGMQTLESGGSVSTVAYSILDLLGCEVICGVGIDSSYGPETNMRAYAQGVRGGSGKKKPPVCHERIPAWGGQGVVASSPQLKTYRDWLAVQARVKDRRHINLSVGGARIEGWHEMELHEWAAAVEDHCDPVKPLTVPYEPLELEWAIAGLEEQLEGAAYASEAVGDAIDLTNRFVETMCTLGKLPQNHHTRLVAGMQMSPLELMARLPGPTEMQAALKINQSFLETVKQFVPLIERCVERMKRRYARAA
jgi:ElaB/YqjD/DUF883 family membrane-anchored ribosome-binding protein